MENPAFSYRMVHKDLVSHRAVLVALFLLLLCSNAFAWWGYGWPYRKPMTLKSSTYLSFDVTTDLVILIDQNSEHTNFWANVYDGNDVRFVNAADDTDLNFYFQKFDKTGQEMLAWVEVEDTFPNASDVNIFMYYGNTGASNGERTANTLTDYEMVYHADDNTGTTVTDQTGTYDGTASNALIWGDTNKRYGNSALNHAAAYDVTQGTVLDVVPSEITVSFWARPHRTIDTTYYLFDKTNDTGGSPDHLRILWVSNGTLSYRAAGNAAEKTINSSSTTWTGGVWFHIIATWNTSIGMLLWANSAGTWGLEGADSSGTTLMNNGTADDAIIGDASGGGLRYFGTIDEFKIMNIGIDGNEAAILHYSENKGLQSYGPEEIPTGYLTLQFYDENTFAAVDPTVTVNGVVQSTTSGLLNYTLTNSAAADFTVEASSGVYSTRQWLFEDLNVQSNVDENVAVLKTTEGAGIDFNFREVDGTTVLASTKVGVRIHDENFSEIRETSATGRVTFFLNNQNEGYFFSIFDNNGEDYNYVMVDANFQTPLDESDLSHISPFDATISGVGEASYLTQSTDFNVILLPNTIGFYEFDVNGGNTYYTRKLEINYAGNPVNNDIQIYLPPVDDGIETVFYTKNKTDLTTEPYILIKCFKTIAGEGRVEVQSVITDEAGTAKMSFIIDDEYSFEVYDIGGNLIFEFVLRPNFTSYYVYIDTEAIEWEEATVEYIIISGLPNVGYVSHTPGEGYDVNVTVDVNNGTVAKSWFTIVNDDGNVTFNNACGSGCGHTLTEADLNSTMSVTVTVLVETTTGVILEKKWTFIPYDASSYNLVATLRSTAFREEWGCSSDTGEPCFFLLVISAFITIAALFGAGSAVTTDTSALAIIAIVLLGIFTYLTWVPATFFILACIAAFGTVVVSRRGF